MKGGEQGRSTAGQSVSVSMITFYRHSESKIIIIIRGFPVCATFRFVCLVKGTTTRTRPLIKHELSPKTKRDSHSTHTHTDALTHIVSHGTCVCLLSAKRARREELFGPPEANWLRRGETANRRAGSTQCQSEAERGSPEACVARPEPP